MNRAYLSLRTRDVITISDAELFGRLASHLPFALEPAQRAAWNHQIQHLRELARELPDAHAFMEFLIPRMGRRADLILLTNGIVFVIANSGPSWTEIPERPVIEIITLKSTSY